MLLDGYESDDLDVIGSPDSLFSVLSNASSNTSVASDDDLWEAKTSSNSLEEAAKEVAEEVLVLGTNDAATDHVGPLDDSHLIACPWAPNFTTMGEEGKTIYTALFTQVSPCDHAAKLEAWDDGLFVESEENLPDWRASCSPLSFEDPVFSHSGPIDNSFMMAKGDSQPSSPINDAVETPLYLQVPNVCDALATTDEGLFIEMGDVLPDWRSTCSPLFFCEPTLSVQQAGVKEEVEVKIEKQVVYKDRLPDWRENCAPLQFSLLPPALMSKIKITEEMYAKASSSIIIRPSSTVDSLDDFSFRQPTKVRKHSVKGSLLKVKKSVVKKVKSVFPGSRRA